MTVVLFPAALAVQTSYRFTVGVRNPPIVVKNVDIVVITGDLVDGEVSSTSKDVEPLKNLKGKLLGVCLKYFTFYG